MELEPIIGLEIHVQLKTASKMFCSCANLTEEAEPNTVICSVCTGQPGALPVVNVKSLELAIRAALALGAQVNPVVRFDRKNYFYPDLPKGYQITQYRLPVGLNGSLAFDVGGQSTTVRIERLHLEEDAAKLTHQADATLIDFNRAGTPLLEIVTAPDFRSTDMARSFLDELKLTLRTLGVSDADMEKGQLRVDANISLRPAGSTELHPKTEIKNLNSFRALERALKFEIARQRELWEQGQPPKDTTTRGWEEGAGKTVERREKEAAHDYRYMPEPDLPPLSISAGDIERIRRHLPELPSQRRTRFQVLYELKDTDAALLVADAELGKYFEEVVTEFREHAEVKLGDAPAAPWWEKQKSAVTALIARFLVNRISRDHRNLHGLPVPAHHTAHLLWMLYQKELTQAAATTLYEEIRVSKESPDAAVARLGLRATADAGALNSIVAKVIEENPKQVEQYRAGKEAVLKFFIGKVVQATKGTSDVNAIADLLREKLKNS